MTVQQLAHDLASRVPAMALDSPLNNAGMIERMIEDCFAQRIVEQAVRLAKWDQERLVACGGHLSPIVPEKLQPWNKESYGKLTEEGQQRGTSFEHDPAVVYES